MSAGSKTAGSKTAGSKAAAAMQAPDAGRSGSGDRSGALHLTGTIRDVERRALAATGDGELMARAAAAVADACALLLRDLPRGTPVLALVGPGNNGGDALQAAALLAERGWRTDALALTARRPTAADAARVWDAWRRSGRPLAHPEQLEPLLAPRPLIVDGMFGIGLARPLPPEAARIAARIAELGLPVVAVDVPSGLDADRGSVVVGSAVGGGGGGDDGDDGPAVAVRATLTVTMIGDKPGLHTGAGASLAGRVIVARLGLQRFLDGTPDPAAAGSPQAPRSDGWLVDAASFRALLRPRDRDAHKGRFGDVLVVGGAAGMRGAALLAALGAQAVGTGRVIIGRFAADAEAGLEAHIDVELGADPVHPELMTRQLATGSEAGAAAVEPTDTAAATGDRSGGQDGHDGRAALGPADAIAIGCGLGTDAVARRLVSLALDHPATPVLDADALNLIAADDRLRRRLRARNADRDLRQLAILTPHPLEAARLLATTTAVVQRDRIDAACRLADSTGAIVVLKGAGTVVAAPDGSWTINASGGPILAVAGTGDVLAGTIAGLVATGLDAPDAARLGVWLHGAAGDMLAAGAGYRAGVGLPARELAAAIRERINRAAAGRC